MASSGPPWSSRQKSLQWITCTGKSMRFYWWYLVRIFIKIQDCWDFSKCRLDKTIHQMHYFWGSLAYEELNIQYSFFLARCPSQLWPFAITVSASCVLIGIYSLKHSAHAPEEHEVSTIFLLWDLFAIILCKCTWKDFWAGGSVLIKEFLLSHP